MFEISPTFFYCMAVISTGFDTLITGSIIVLNPTPRIKVTGYDVNFIWQENYIKWYSIRNDILQQNK